jgi:molybdopterin converting factor small subunit
MARVLLFAGVRTAVGQDEIAVACGDGVSADAFWDKVTDNFPVLATWRTHCRLARNHAFLVPGEVVTDDDIVAILPPVSGG